MQALSPTPPAREPIGIGLAGTLLSFKGYIYWLTITQNATPDQSTCEGYNKFQTSPNWNPELLFKSPPNLGSKASPHNLADDFRRGIKCDQSHYTAFKEHKQWDS